MKIAKQFEKIPNNKKETGSIMKCVLQDKEPKKLWVWTR